MVGTAALILVSSVMFWLSSSGTFKSALTNTFFPFKSDPDKSPTLFFAIQTTPPRVDFPLIAPILDATWTENSGSAAENPRRAAPLLRDAGSLNRDARAIEGEEAEEAEAEAADLRREKVVGAVAEAIV